MKASSSFFVEFYFPSSSKKELWFCKVFDATKGCLSLSVFIHLHFPLQFWTRFLCKVCARERTMQSLKEKQINEIVVYFLTLKTDEKWCLSLLNMRKHSSINMLSNGDKLQRVFKVMQRNNSNKFPWQVFIPHTNKSWLCGCIPKRHFSKDFYSIFSSPLSFLTTHFFSVFFLIGFTSIVCIPSSTSEVKSHENYGNAHRSSIDFLHRNFLSDSFLMQSITITDI